MVTTTLPPQLVKIQLPSREELREMLTSTPVAVTLIICVTVIGSLAIGAVVFLAYTGHDSAVIGALIAGALAAVGGLMNSRINRLSAKVEDKSGGTP